jgi:hypothetical protein
MIGNKFSKTFEKPVLIITLIIVALSFLGGFRIMHYLKSPDVLLLINHSGAQWIKYNSAFELNAKPAKQTGCEFKYIFKTNKKTDNVRIAVQALKRCRVFLDGVNIFSSPYESDNWKKVHDINVPFAVEAGAHEILIMVTSEDSPPAVLAYSDTLPVRTGSEWLSSYDGKDWEKAVPASQVIQPAISKNFPSSGTALASIWPCLAIVFVIVLFMPLFFRCVDNGKKKFLSWWTEPSHVRWVMLFLWAVLAINNMFKLSFQAGPDVWGHIEYIDYIVRNGSLPLASEGWQMFQAPLNYILSAPLYALLMKWFDLPSVVKMMAILPVVCGLLQIEIVYRVARIVFADRKDLQMIAMITGSMLPIHTYVCQYVGNEPLAGFFISLLILLCLSLIMPDQKERHPGYFVLLGFVWGLALLTKMNAVPFILVLLIVLAFHTRLLQKPLKRMWMPFIIVFSVSMLISGWYYLRNCIKLGSPFAGLIFDRLQITYWWQDPGYRTWSQILSFGHSLKYPVYSGVTSFWDMLYSTLWLDGLNSGLMDFIPWNENYMVAGTLLALLPGMLILAGIVSIWLNKKTVYRNAAIFSTGTIALFLAMMIDIVIVRSAYSVTKSTYTLGLLPCYAILVAAGAEPFFRNRIIRTVTIALFACWAFAAYVAYFVVKYQ